MTNYDEHGHRIVPGGRGQRIESLAEVPPLATAVPPPPPPPPPPGGWPKPPGLAEQEIRARALDAAAALLAGRDAYNLGDVEVMDAATGALALAVQFEAYIRDGEVPDA